jgi:LCP family protein required for cell wall assembly
MTTPPTQSQASSQPVAPDDALNDSPKFPSCSIKHHKVPPRPRSSTPAWPRRLAKGLLWSLVFSGTAALAVVVGGTATMMLPGGETGSGADDDGGSFGALWQSGFRHTITRPVNILVMGVDAVPEAEDDPSLALEGRSDTMLLVRADPENQVANVLSIPRDTRVEVPGYGITKVNQANSEGGAVLAARTVSANLGNVTIDRYVRIDTTAFRNLVDLVGGIEVEVPRAMRYRDQTQGLEIDLQPGLQRLDGDQAEQFARFRQDAYGDIGRVQRQQVLLRALRDRLTEPSVLPRLPQALRIVQQSIDTNLSLEEMLALVGFAMDLESDQFQMVMLPGRFSEPGEYLASYWIQDRQGIDQMMGKFFDTQPMTLVSDNTSSNRLRIAVQNASTHSGVAEEVAAYLRDQGYRNVYVVQDWSSTLSGSQVIAQRGNLDSARTLQTALGFGDVVADSTGDLSSDLTIRVGDDWPQQQEDLSSQDRAALGLGF